VWGFAGRTQEGAEERAERASRLRALQREALFVTLVHYLTRSREAREVWSWVEAVPFASSRETGDHSHAPSR